MWHHKFLKRLDLKVIFIVVLLQIISLGVISSMTAGSDSVMSYYVRSQAEWFIIGWGVFLFFAGFDYGMFRESAWFLYAFMIQSHVCYYR